jgi:hypothetical protein
VRRRAGARGSMSSPLAGIALVVAGSVCFGAATFVVIERPDPTGRACRRLPRRRSRQRRPLTSQARSRETARSARSRCRLQRARVPSQRARRQTFAPRALFPQSGRSRLESRRGKRWSSSSWPLERSYPQRPSIAFARWGASVAPPPGEPPHLWVDVRVVLSTREARDPGFARTRFDEIVRQLRAGGAWRVQARHRGWSVGELPLSTLEPVAMTRSEE